jgi:hypothetical protein
MQNSFNSRAAEQARSRGTKPPVVELKEEQSSETAFQALAL